MMTVHHFGQNGPRCKKILSSWIHSLAAVELINCLQPLPYGLLQFLQSLNRQYISLQDIVAHLLEDDQHLLRLPIDERKDVQPQRQPSDLHSIQYGRPYNRTLAMNRIAPRNANSTANHSQDHYRDTPVEDIESLLVSSVRYEAQISDLKKRPTASLIKRQFPSNVYIEDRSESSYHSLTPTPHCSCHQRSRQLEEQLKLLTLKLQELESRLTLNFHKQAQQTTQTAEQEKQQEESRQIVWEMGQKLDSIGLGQEQMLYKLNTTEQEVEKLRKIVLKWEGKEKEKTSLETRMLEHKLQKLREDHEHKLSALVETVEQLGSLQRKLLQQETYQASLNCSISLPRRAPSLSSKQPTESTSISYSRNCELH